MNDFDKSLLELQAKLDEAIELAAMLNVAIATRDDGAMEWGEKPRMEVFSILPLLMDARKLIPYA